MDFSIKIKYTIALFLIFGKSIAQTAVSDVAGYTPNPKAVLDINSTTKGLLLPRLTSAQRIAIAPTASQAGLTVFDTNTKSQWFYDGTIWKEMSGGFSLPYSGTNNTGANALDINNTVGRAAYFQSPNSSETMRVYNSGTGNAITVDGHLNVTGDLKTNGATGTAGQVLQNNGNGTIGWVNKCDFKNSVIFYQGNDIPFTVPSGITKLWIEVWGAGAGGSSLGGGGGGGYASLVATVTPNATFTVTVGLGGLGGTTFATNGGASWVENGNYDIIAFGGGEYGTALLSSSSAIITGIGAENHTYHAGIFGHSIRQRSIQLGTSNFFYIVEGGEGGDTYGPENVGSAGVYTGPGAPYQTPEKGKIPGGGGGAGGVIISSTGVVTTNNAGSNGGDGRVIIHW